MTKVDFSESITVDASDVNDGDVIFGRGNAVLSWPGNVALRHVVWAHRHLYACTRKNKKREIGMLVLSKVKEIDGRFLMLDQETGFFHIVDDDRSIEKVCQALREKEMKEPQGFDLKNMKNIRKWFRKIVQDHPTSIAVTFSSSQDNTDPSTDTAPSSSSPNTKKPRNPQKGKRTQHPNRIKKTNAAPPASSPNTRKRQNPDKGKRTQHPNQIKKTQVTRSKAKLDKSIDPNQRCTPNTVIIHTTLDDATSTIAAPPPAIDEHNHYCQKEVENSKLDGGGYIDSEVDDTDDLSVSFDNLIDLPLPAFIERLFPLDATTTTAPTPATTTTTSTSYMEI